MEGVSVLQGRAGGVWRWRSCHRFSWRDALRLRDAAGFLGLFRVGCLGCGFSRGLGSSEGVQLAKYMVVGQVKGRCLKVLKVTVHMSSCFGSG